MAAPYRPPAGHRRSARIPAAIGGGPPANTHISFRSDLQKNRDRVASRISKKWLVCGHPGPQGSRGIVNPGNWCYINSALQALMHQPQLLNWLEKHNRRVKRGARGSKTLNACNADLGTDENDTPPPCTACTMKGLANTYWANTLTTKSIPNPGGDMQRIRDIACANGVAEENPIGTGIAQMDSDEFYQKILDRLQSASAEPEWGDAFSALFHLNTKEYGECNICRNRRSIAQRQEVGIMLGVPRKDMPFQEALGDRFGEDRIINCPICVSNTNHIVTTDILAGPQILKIKLLMFQQDLLKDGKGRVISITERKVMHAMAHPNILDLTQYQENNTLSLRYRLSSVISHFGEGTGAGHYVASVRGQGEQITCISDITQQRLTQAQFEASPQVADASATLRQIYVLTYLRDDGRLTKAQREIKKLDSTLQ